MPTFGSVDTSVSCNVPTGLTSVPAAAVIWSIVSGAGVEAAAAIEFARLSSLDLVIATLLIIYHRVKTSS